MQYLKSTLYQYITLPLFTTSHRYITEALAMLLDTFSEVDIINLVVTMADSLEVIMVVVTTDIKLSFGIEFTKA